MAEVKDELEVSGFNIDDKPDMYHHRVINKTKFPSEASYLQSTAPLPCLLLLLMFLKTHYSVMLSFGKLVPDAEVTSQIFYVPQWS